MTRAIESDSEGYEFILLSEETKDQINIVNVIEHHFPIHDIPIHPSDSTIVISTDKVVNNLPNLSRDIGAGIHPC